MTWFKYPEALAAFLHASEEAEPHLDAVEEELGPRISALEARSRTLGPWEQQTSGRFNRYLMRFEGSEDRWRGNMARLRVVNWIRPDGTFDFSVLRVNHPPHWVLDLVSPRAPQTARERLSGPLRSDATTEEAQAWADEQLRARGWILLAPEDVVAWKAAAE